MVARPPWAPDGRRLRTTAIHLEVARGRRVAPGGSFGRFDSQLRPARGGRPGAWERGAMHARLIAIGEREVGGPRYAHDVAMDAGRIRRRRTGVAGATPALPAVSSALSGPARRRRAPHLIAAARWRILRWR